MEETEVTRACTFWAEEIHCTGIPYVEVRLCICGFVCTQTCCCVYVDVQVCIQIRRVRFYTDTAAGDENAGTIIT